MTTPLKKREMIPLQNQEMFEQLIGRAETKDPLPIVSVVYFTAKWCGACKRLNLDLLMANHPTVTWYKCDIDQNDYTAGFCSIRQIPTFLIVKEKEILGTLSHSDTMTVSKWISEKV